MAVRIGPRIEVRLDEEHREKLQEVLDARGCTVSDFVRAEIDRRHHEIEIERWESQVRYLQETAPELPPWEVLKEEISHMHCPGGDCCDRPEMHEPLVR